jgi:hypothetical protein
VTLLLHTSSSTCSRCLELRHSQHLAQETFALDWLFYRLFELLADSRRPEQDERASPGTRFRRYRLSRTSSDHRRVAGLSNCYRVCIRLSLPYFSHILPIICPLPLPFAFIQSLLISLPSFINTQLRLEADAREVLPYVSQSCHLFHITLF